MTDEDHDGAVSKELEAEQEETGDREPIEGTIEPPPDEAADAFLELESELATSETATSSGDVTRPAALVVGARKVSAGAVPDSYPREIRAQSALELQVLLRGGERTAVYLGWPEDGGIDPDSSLGRLLAVLDVSPAEFADLYGEELLLEREGGHYTVFLPPEPPRGTGNWELGVF
ncbi:MAG: hypothetical protein V5A46_04715, partial [Haloferacaceae archaeon]